MAFNNEENVRYNWRASETLYSVVKLRIGDECFAGAVKTQNLPKIHFYLS